MELYRLIAEDPRLYRALSANPSLPPSMFMEHFRPWDWENIVNLNQVALHQLKNLPTAAQTSIHAVKNRPFWDVLDPSINWHEPSEHVFIPIKNIKKVITYPIFTGELANNPNVRIEDIVSIDFNWDLTHVFRKPNVLKFYQPTTITHWDDLSGNESILPSDLARGCWNLRKVAANPAITIREMEQINLPWNWSFACKKASINDVLTHPGRFTNWTALSQSIPVEDILRHAHLPWDWHEVSKRVPYALVEGQNRLRHSGLILNPNIPISYPFAPYELPKRLKTILL